MKEFKICDCHLLIKPVYDQYAVYLDGALIPYYMEFVNTHWYFIDGIYPEKLRILERYLSELIKADLDISKLEPFNC